MNLPIENISDIINNMSTLQEYKNIRESFNLKDNQIKYLIDIEYNKRLDAFRNKEKTIRDEMSNLPLIVQLYLLHNPEKKYRLLEISTLTHQVYDVMVGTRKEILKRIEETAIESISDYTDMNISVNEDAVLENSMMEYEKEINAVIDNINNGKESSLIPQFETIFFNEQHTLYYLLTKYND